MSDPLAPKDHPFSLPHDDVAAAAAWYRRARLAGTFRESDLDTLYMLHDDPEPLRAALEVVDAEIDAAPPRR